VSSSVENISKQINHLYEIISTNFHEAGHTICGLLNFVKIESVSVSLNSKNYIEGSTNYCCLQPNDSSLKNFVTSEVSLKYAGTIAEKIHFKMISGSDKFPSCLKAGSSDDVATAAKLMAKFNLAPSGKERIELKKSLQNKVEQDLIFYWEDVVLIAQALYRDKALSYLEIKKILLSQSPKNLFWTQRLQEIEDIY